MPFDPRARTAHRTARRGRHGHRSRPRRERTAERTRRRTGGQRRRIDGIMATNDALGPFRAGPGSPPPYLARTGGGASRLPGVPERAAKRTPSTQGDRVLRPPRQRQDRAARLVAEGSRFPLRAGRHRLTPAAARTEARLVERLLPASMVATVRPGQGLRLRAYLAAWRGTAPARWMRPLPRAPRRSPWCWCSTKPIPWRTRSEGRC